MRYAKCKKCENKTYTELPRFGHFCEECQNEFITFVDDKYDGKSISIIELDNMLLDFLLIPKGEYVKSEMISLEKHFRDNTPTFTLNDVFHTLVKIQTGSHVGDHLQMLEYDDKGVVIKEISKNDFMEMFR